ncbi:MAG: PQQ-dependent sugar dehydrogenase [Segetibacter sp.]
MRKFKMIMGFGAMLILMSCDFSNDGQSQKPQNTLASSINTSAESGKYSLTEAFPELEFDQPVELTSPNDNTDRIFVIAQKGIIHVLPNKPDVNKAAVFLDISNQVESGGEKGLLGLAFHPDYKSNGFFYVNYTKGNPLETIISRFKVSASRSKCSRS